MRIARIQFEGRSTLAFYDESGVTPLSLATRAFRDATAQDARVEETDDVLRVLPGGADAEAAEAVAAWLVAAGDTAPRRIPLEQAELLVPTPRPNKLFLLAGNYAAHLAEGGEIATERAETFPYVFMKPPSTTLTHPGRPVRIPQVSPDHVDWELELAVVIGREARGVSEEEALQYVAGYTVVNDISDRKFRPTPNRKERPRDKFFDWLHGKWHDSFCPCGPCVASTRDIPDPQSLRMELKVNGEVKQSASTSQQIFPVAAVVAFLSSFVTLEPGDVISTGTSAGVGNTSGQYLQSGDRIDAWIEKIGSLRTPVVQ